MRISDFHALHSPAFCHFDLIIHCSLLCSSSTICSSTSPLLPSSFELHFSTETVAHVKPLSSIKSSLLSQVLSSSSTISDPPRSTPMPGRPLRMSRSDSRYGTPHGVSSCQRTCGGVPAHIPPRKKSSPPTPSPIAFDAATSSPLDPNRSEPQATTGAGRRGRRRGRRRRGPRSRKGE